MFNWKILELFANGDQLISVRYKATLSDDKNTVETEGNHVFSKGIVNKKLEDIVESDLIQWLEKDTAVDDVNHLKLNLQIQLQNVKNIEKVDFPWLANTFTIG